MKIQGLYTKRDWYYYQPPTVEGVRPSPIALRTQDPGEAVDRAYELHSKNALGKQSRERMAELLEVYLAAQRAARVHTLRTSDITRRVLGKLATDWGNPKVADIDRKKIEAWRAELQARPGYGWIEGGEAGAAKKPTMSEGSISSYLRRLSGFLTWLIKEKHLRSHPMDEIRLGRVKKTKREKFCTVEERERLLSDPPNEDIDFLLHFGFFAGLRFGEMLAMQDTWLVKLDGGGWLLSVQETSFWKPKDQEARTIEVHPRLAAFIDRVGLRKPFMLAAYKKVWKDEPAYRYNPKKAFKAHAKKHGLEWVTYHTMRHTLATHLASKGARMIEIAQILGDSLRVTEENYVGFSPVSRSVLAEV